jgi:hypothetical protein
MYDASTNAHACAQENDMLALASQLTDRSRLHIDNDIDDLGHDQRALMVQVHELTVAIKRERERARSVCLLHTSDTTPEGGAWQKTCRSDTNVACNAGDVNTVSSVLTSILYMRGTVVCKH